MNPLDDLINYELLCELSPDQAEVYIAQLQKQVDQEAHVEPLSGAASKPHHSNYMVVASASADVAALPMCSETGRFCQRMGGLPRDVLLWVDLYGALAERARDQKLTYLPLPAVIALVSEHPVYPDALCWGRGFFFDDLHGVDELGNVVRVPDPFSREEILEIVKGFVFIEEMRLAAMTPLPWRVGVAVGWLSGLAVSQKDDAQATMAVLAALVAPLLLDNKAGQGKLGKTKTKLVKRGAKSKRSRSGRK